jgi:hypothetical protein
MAMEHCGISDTGQRSAQRKTTPDALIDMLEMKSCRNAPFSFAMSVSPNDNSRTAEMIFMKLDYGEFSCRHIPILDKE